jgi:hypothetical protein
VSCTVDVKRDSLISAVELSGRQRLHKQAFEAEKRDERKGTCDAVELGIVVSGPVREASIDYRMLSSER